jgi:hypothetical protein
MFLRFQSRFSLPRSHFRFHINSVLSLVSSPLFLVNSRLSGSVHLPPFPAVFRCLLSLSVHYESRSASEEYDSSVDSDRRTRETWRRRVEDASDQSLPKPIRAHRDPLERARVHQSLPESAVARQGPPGQAKAHQNPPELIKV